MSSSNFQVGIVIILCFVAYYLVSLSMTIDCLNRRMDFSNTTVNASSENDLRNVIYALNPSTVWQCTTAIPFWFSMIMNFLFIVSLWYFFYPLGKS